MCGPAHSPVWGLIKGILSVVALAGLGYLLVHDHLPASKKTAGFIEIQDGRAVVVR